MTGPLFTTRPTGDLIGDWVDTIPMDHAPCHQCQSMDAPKGTKQVNDSLLLIFFLYPGSFLSENQLMRWYHGKKNKNLPHIPKDLGVLSHMRWRKSDKTLVYRHIGSGDKTTTMKGKIRPSSSWK